MSGDGQIDAEIISLLSRPEGAVEGELARAAGDWTLQVEWLMRTGQVEKVQSGELRFRFTERARTRKKTLTIGDMLERLKCPLRSA